ncbi:MAG: hypothetical protein OES79_05015 [Planctomycetota bacterium]|nr:hypothetical protein [Planctomycetota bacterium]
MHGCRRLPAATFATVAICLCAVAAGCNQEAQIHQYLIPKEEVVQEVGRRKLATKDRMLVAMFRQGDKGWFFKLGGANDRVTRHAGDFRDLVKSVRFADNGAGQPNWTLPDGWRQQAGGGAMRFATLEIPDADDQLELTVVPLGITQDDEQQYLLENVNRWRGQMQLPPVEGRDLSSQIETLDVAGTEAIVIDLIGNLQSGSRMRPPFLAGDGGPSSRPGAAADRAGPGLTGHDPSVLACQPPSGWRPARLGFMDKALYQVQDGEHQIEISVRSAGGRLLDNINRWRGQIQLDRINEEQLAAALEPITVDNQEGSYIEISGQPAAATAIYGVVVDVGGSTWFVKLRGNAELAQREKENFRAFAESLRFKSG